MLKTTIKIFILLFIIIISILLYVTIVDPHHFSLLDYNDRQTFLLSKAIKNGNIDKVKQIAKHGKVFTDARTGYDSTPLLIATICNNYECVCEPARKIDPL
jgi:hypothetical protein